MDGLDSDPTVTKHFVRDFVCVCVCVCKWCPKLWHKFTFKSGGKNTIYHPSTGTDFVDLWQRYHVYVLETQRLQLLPVHNGFSS
jgi:hypothetical protein